MLKLTHLFCFYFFLYKIGVHLSQKNEKKTQNRGCSCWENEMETICVERFVVKQTLAVKCQTMNDCAIAMICTNHDKLLIKAFRHIQLINLLNIVIRDES